jgi:hypothetical protein
MNVESAAFAFAPEFGLVLNFGLERMKDGITRIVNELSEPPSPMEEVE